MNRKFMPIFSQISPTFLLFSAYLFIKIRRLFLREQDCILYTTEVSWLSVNYCRISKEKKVLVELYEILTISHFSLCRAPFIS